MSQKTARKPPENRQKTARKPKKILALKYPMERFFRIGSVVACDDS